MGAGARAATVQFGTIANPSDFPATAPSPANVGTLAVTQAGAGLTFSLSLSNLVPTFGSGSFVRQLGIDYAGALGADFTISSISGGGVTTVGLSNVNQHGGIQFEFGFDFGQGANDRLYSNETVSWQVLSRNNTGTKQNPVYVTVPLAENSFTGAVVHVQGINATSFGSETSAWYLSTVTPVPEPHEWAMLLAGLGMVGVMAKRRRSARATA
jgi:hypothetical protein